MIVPLFFLILIFLNLIFVKFLLNRMNSYIAENGKSSMGAVVEQIQQTYDLQVNGYYSRLHMLEDFLTQEGVRSIELDRNKKFFEAWQKESESTLIFLQENGKAITTDGTKLRVDMPSEFLLDLSKDRIVIFSTHIIEDISSSCNQVVVINKGELKYFGDPSDMVEMANGKVWQFNIDKTEFEKVLDKSLVIHHIQEGDTIRVRYLSVGQPYEGAVEVEANLEDAYLCLLKNMN